MNREIKFRAWDKVLNEFLPNVQNHINDEEWAFGRMLKNDRWIIMQYTGLKDKNGKERFEGDIIKRSTGYIFVEKVIEFRMGDRNCATCFGYNYHKDDEVVGNIVENPELLK